MTINKEIKVIFNVNNDEELLFIEDLDEEIIINNKAQANLLKELADVIKTYDYGMELCRYYAEKEQWGKCLKLISQYDNEKIIKSLNLKEDVLLKAKVLLKNKEFFKLENFLNNDGIKALEFKELFYFKGKVNEETKYNYLAIKFYLEFLTAIDIVEGEFKDLGCEVELTLANLLFKEKAYSEAMIYYEKYLTNYKGSRENLVNYGISILRSVTDKNRAYEIIRQSFRNNGINGIYLAGELFFHGGWYEAALKTYMEGSKAEYSDRFLFRIAELFMYMGEYEKSREIFGIIPTDSRYAFEGIMNKILLEVIQRTENVEEELLWIEDISLKRALEILVSEDEETKDKLGKLDADKILKWYMKILEQLLKAAQYELFEKGVLGLNYIDSPFVLTELAALYKENHFEQLAREEVEKSIENFHFVTESDIDILYHIP